MWTSRDLNNLLLGQGDGVKEGLHRCPAEAPSSLVGSYLVVLANPGIQVGLQLLDRADRSASPATARDVRRALQTLGLAGAPADLLKVLEDWNADRVQEAA